MKLSNSIRQQMEPQQTNPGQFSVPLNSRSTQAERVSAGRQSTWLTNSKTRKTWEFQTSSHEQRLSIIRQAEVFSGHDFFILVSNGLDHAGFSENELVDLAKIFVENHCHADQGPAMNERQGAFTDWDWISNLFDRLPEQALWQLLRGVIATRAELSDEAIMKLNDSMQGQLFYESQVHNRLARIAFARSAENIIFMRDAAGSKNVWMDDEEFSSLVGLNDSETLACFARCEQMKPHHLFLIKQKLAADPHRSEFLATSYDTAITLMKALEVQGNTPEMSWMRQASETATGAVQLWQNYLDIKAGALVSSSSPVRASEPNHHLLN
ncbi:hypothetical protein ACFL1V_03420 [Pseudomonadota bacterium]